MVPFLFAGAYGGPHLLESPRRENTRKACQSGREQKKRSSVIILPFPFLFLFRVLGRESFQDLVTGISGSGKDHRYQKQNKQKFHWLSSLFGISLLGLLWLLDLPVLFPEIPHIKAWGKIKQRGRSQRKHHDGGGQPFQGMAIKGFLDDEGDHDE